VEIFNLSWGVIFFKFCFPPLFYAFHGWIATKMAIWALFHPYNAWRIPGTNWIVPGTPGIFPKRRDKLARAVATTVTETLLTSEDIRLQAETLLTEANIQLAIDALVESILAQFRDTANLHRLAASLADLSPTLLEHLVLSVVDGIKKGNTQRVAAITEKIFDQLVLSIRITDEQAAFLSARLIEAAITSDRIRRLTIALLNDNNIDAIDESIQAHAGVVYRIAARIIGVRRVCKQWRNFFEQEPLAAEELIVDLTKRFRLEEQLAVQIANLDLRAMPLQSITNLRRDMVNYISSFLVEHSDVLVSTVRKIEAEARGTVASAIIRFNPEELPTEWLVRLKYDLALFLHQYLKRELGMLLERALPALGMYGLITRKIDLFSPQQLEKLINQLCEQELKWLAILGGIIGAWLGLIQIAVNVAFP
jgi:uncharacterized membrane protein YheB (UPF0754 family)